MNIVSEKLLKEILNTHYNSGNYEIENQLLAKLVEIINSNNKFDEKLKELNITLLPYKITEDFEELIFDIILFDFFDEYQKHDPNYFESKEWLRIEERILDRGTELFNILMYLRECVDNKINISLDDYIDEYLMCEDDFENLETQYYEDILKNRQVLQNHDINVYSKIAEKNQNGPLENQLLPLLLFFLPDEKIEKKLEKITKQNAAYLFQQAFLKVLTSYKNINKLKYEYVNN
ncbi:MAG: hypothetical protein IT243_09410 [Bacteroidia bacterium]|nr:hypothetical protein [Bacteroidia bacterium]